MSDLCAAVVGTGHLGQHHARVYAGLEGVELVGVVDTDEKQGKSVAKKCKTSWYADYESLLRQVDLASIAAPTRSHYPIARDFIAAGVPVLIEKPMTSTLEEAEELVRFADEKGCLVQVGHIERFNPAIVEIQKILTRPGYIEADRISPFSFRSVEIGVVLDLMIHDIDIILLLTKSEVESVDAVGVNVLSSGEDVANARLRFASGCVATLTASRVSMKSERKIRIFQEDTYISLDYQERRARIYRVSDKVKSSGIDLTQFDPKKLSDLKSLVFGDLLEVQDIRMGNEEPLAEELSAFVRSVRAGEPPAVSAADGLKAIRVAEQIREGIAVSAARLSAGEE